jgi:pimeloyl-ACP methyl ester carboxylesterase
VLHLSSLFYSYTKTEIMQTNSVHSEGAELVFDTYGSSGGTPLLLIPGGGGDAAIYGRMASILASEFTVITYDRR